MRNLLRFLVVVLFYFLSSGYAQITITASDIQAAYGVGNMFTISSDSGFNSYDIGSPGGGNTWDFSGVTANTSFMQSSVDPSSTPFSGDFPNANIALFSSLEANGTTSNIWVYSSLVDDWEYLG